ncbi:MAG TPA: hypothetical protein VIR27_18435 [Mycobacteriales bacterium]
MGIDLKDFMHGAVLVAIAEDPRFTALNKGSTHYGHYLVNHDRHMFVKYNSGPGDYYFTFSAEEVRRILGTRRPQGTFVVLVCGHEAITGISSTELRSLIDVRSSAQQQVRVSARPRKQLRLYGPGHSELGPIPRNAFPDRVLG